MIFIGNEYAKYRLIGKWARLGGNGAEAVHQLQPHLYFHRSSEVALFSVQLVGKTDIHSASHNLRLAPSPRSLIAQSPSSPPPSHKSMPATKELNLRASLSVLLDDRKRVNDIGYLHRCTLFQLDDARYKARSH